MSNKCRAHEFMGHLPLWTLVVTFELPSSTMSLGLFNVTSFWFGQLYLHKRMQWVVTISDDLDGLNCWPQKLFASNLTPQKGQNPLGLGWREVTSENGPKPPWILGFLSQMRVPRLALFYRKRGILRLYLGKKPLFFQLDGLEVNFAPSVYLQNWKKVTVI